MRRLIPWITCLILLLCRISPAQKTAAPTAGPLANVTPTVVEEIEPSVYYVQDKDGKLVPMFGFQLEDFMRAFKQLQGHERKEIPPRFVIEEMSVVGRVVGRTAELSIRFTVRLRKEGPIRVPLGLSEAVVRLTGAGGSDPGGQPEPGGQRQLLEHTGRDGYVVWLDGELEKPQEVAFDVLVPLKTVGSETSLRLQAPRATKSELRLTVPSHEPGADKTVAENSRGKTIRGRVSQGATLESLAASDAGGVEFVARGLSSDFQLSWHDAGVGTTRTPTVLTVSGRILARIDEHSVNTEATLEVSGHGSPFDRFRVHLPHGAELLASGPPGHTVVEVPWNRSEATGAEATGAEAANRGEDNNYAVEIHLPKKTLGPVKIRLATRQSHGQDSSGQLVELCGFEVEGAARQWGHIAVAVADDIHVSWNQQYRVRQVDDLPDALRHEDVVAGFAYSAQPCSLKAWVVPRKTRLSVEPEYLIFVDGNGVRLESTLRYMIRGKKAFLLEIDLADWELDEVGPATMVAVDGLDVDKSNTLRIPLLRRSAGKIEITLKAHRRLPMETKELTQKKAHRRLPVETKELTQKKAHRRLPAEIKELKLRLPAPRVSTSSSAAVVIQPADNVELIPNDDANVELTRQQVTGARNLPAGYQQRPLFYRGEASKAVFVGERSIHARKVAVDVESRAILDRKTCLVSQRFSYRIDYQPLRFLEINVPRTVADRGELEFEVGGRKVVAAASAGKNDQTAASDSTAMAIPLASPGRIGQVELVVRYPLHWEELPPRASILREIPLLMPRNAELVGNRLSVKAEPPLKVGMHDETWTLETQTLENGAQTPASQRSVLELSNPNPSPKAVVAVHCEERSRRKSTVVRKAWIYTDLTGPSRQDWAAFLVYSSQADLDIFLPRGVGHDDVDLFLDGKSVHPQEASENHLRLALPAESQVEHLLELRYHCPGDRAAPGRMSLDLPRVGKDVWNRRLYWELILPRNEHVMLNPAGFVSEYTWGWNGFFWGQKPVCGRDYLADWMGVWREGRSGGKTQLPGEPGRHGTNRYVFSTLGKPAACEYYTIGRSWIVLWASFAALVAGLVLIYVPLIRHPATLLAAGLGLLATGLIFPAATLLALQAAVLGIALVLMAGLFERILARRRHRATILETGSSILDKDSTQTQHIVATPPLDSTTSGANRVPNGSSSTTSGQIEEE